MTMEIQTDLIGYVSLAEANNYHQARLSNEQWQALSDQQKAQRLLQAADYLDVSYRYKGKKAQAEQSRAFPRFGQLSVPHSVKYAQCELALYADLTANASPFKSAVKIGEISVNYQQQTVANHVENQRFAYVAALLSEYCRTNDDLQTVTLQRE